MKGMSSYRDLKANFRYAVHKLFNLYRIVSPGSHEGSPYPIQRKLHYDWPSNSTFTCTARRMSMTPWKLFVKLSPFSIQKKLSYLSIYLYVSFTEFLRVPFDEAETAKLFNTLLGTCRMKFAIFYYYFYYCIIFPTLLFLSPIL